MLTVTSLWIPFTVIAALGQVARNAMQRSLTKPLGTWGATNIRFLFGFPFSLLFLGLVLLATGDHIGMPPSVFWPWLLLGALSQIVATGLMLLAMNDRSFVVTTAYLKTEAIQTAIFGFVFLGDRLTVIKVIAILIATVGVVVTALRPGGTKGFGSLKPTMLGLVAAAFFALSAVGYRGAILDLLFDEALQSKVRQVRQQASAQGPKLSPREIQAHIRSGMSAMAPRRRGMGWT